MSEYSYASLQENPIFRKIIPVTEQERSQIIHSIIDKKNALMAQGRYTDAVDEVILKMMKAKKKAFIVRTVS